MAYRASSLRGLAVAQMVFGALMIVFGLACIFAAHHWTSYVGFGVWVGSWVFITGILGYVGARDDSKPNKCLIGCFMGFSIFACVIAGTMFICYAVTLADYSKFKHCVRTSSYNSGYRSSYYYWGSDYCYNRYDMKRETAANVAGLGSCLLIFSIVEFFLALAASIYCCAGVCCNTPSGPARSTAASNQQVMFIPQQPQYMYPGAQGGMVLMQPSGAMTTMPQAYQAAGQQAVFVPSSQAGVPVQQPVFWGVPPGSNPAGTVTVSYAGAAGTQVQNPGQVQQPPKDYERPPPYSYTQTGNAPPSTASGVTPSEAVSNPDV